MIGVILEKHSSIIVFQTEEATFKNESLQLPVSACAW